MFTRRKFVIQGSMAMTLALALKPFPSIARAISSASRSGKCSGKLVLLHTSNPDVQFDSFAIEHITGLENHKANALLFHSSRDSKQKPGTRVYDLEMEVMHNPVSIPDSYKIIQKGNIKTGILYAKPNDAAVIEQVNSLSAFLKKEKGCNLVICLSQLGYKNKNAIDDITLAQQSKHLDFIICGNATNVHKHPVIMLNQNNEEVVIHSAVNEIAALGKIDIDFNEQGLKSFIQFSQS